MYHPHGRAGRVAGRSNKAPLAVPTGGRCGTTSRPFDFSLFVAPLKAVEGGRRVCVPRKRHVEPEDLLARWPRAMLSRQKEEVRSRWAAPTYHPT